MRELEEIKRILRAHKADLAERFKVKSIGIFGSYVRGEQGERSDLDVLVEFDEPIDLLEFCGLQIYLSELLGVEVDLVLKSGLKPRIGRRILKEVTYL